MLRQSYSESGICVHTYVSWDGDNIENNYQSKQNFVNSEKGFSEYITDKILIWKAYYEIIDYTRIMDWGTRK